MREYSSSSSDFLPHASLSLDYGAESPVSGTSVGNLASYPGVQECLGTRLWEGEGAECVFVSIVSCCLNLLQLSAEQINFSSFKEGERERRDS